MSEKIFGMGFSMQETSELEQQIEIEVTALGPVLEGEGAISSRLVEKDYPAFAEALKQSVRRVENDGYTACIDGRRTLHMASGDPGKTRLRKAGAGLAPFMMLAIGDRNFQRALDSGATSAEDFYAAVDDSQRAIGRKASGHFGCGAGEGAPDHADAVGGFGLDGSTANAVISLMRFKNVSEEQARASVRTAIESAKSFGPVLRRIGWSGKDYVEQLAERDPNAVEVLETNDSPLHGHDEQAVVLVDSDDDDPEFSIDKNVLLKLTGAQAFVINLDEIRRDARRSSTSRAQAIQLTAAGYLYHGGVFKKLGSNQPVFLVNIRDLARSA